MLFSVYHILLFLASFAQFLLSNQKPGFRFRAGKTHDIIL